jgi:uncharacterized protein with HEPN domain
MSNEDLLKEILRIGENANEQINSIRQDLNKVKQDIEIIKKSYGNIDWAKVRNISNRIYPMVNIKTVNNV